MGGIAIGRGIKRAPCIRRKDNGLNNYKKVYLKCHGNVLILIDETKPIGGYKAIVAAIPSRQRAIPSANADVNLFEF